MTFLINITTASTIINIILTLSLSYIYLKNLIKIKSSFTVGLVIFTSLFLLQNIVSFYFLITMMPYFVDEVESYIFLFSILQTLAFIVLNWITWR